MLYEVFNSRGVIHLLVLQYYVFFVSISIWNRKNAFNHKIDVTRLLIFKTRNVILL